MMEKALKNNSLLSEVSKKTLTEQTKNDANFPVYKFEKWRDMFLGSVFFFLFFFIAIIWHDLSQSRLGDFLDYNRCQKKFFEGAFGIYFFVCEARFG